MKTKLIGYTHGRYEPLHNGHFSVHLEILRDYDFLWVGITNPLRIYPPNMEQLDSDLRKSLEHARAPENNPYNYAQRLEMTTKSLIYQGVDIGRVRVLPHFGYYDMPNWRDFMPPKECSDIVLAPKDIHHEKKMEIYRREGWNVVTVPQIPGVSGKIFDQEFPDGDWRRLVPRGTLEVIEEAMKKTN